MNFLTWKILDSLQRWLHSPPVRQDPRFLGVAGCNNAVHMPFTQLPNFGLERWAFCLCAKLATRAVQDLWWYKSGCPWYQKKPCVWSFWLILISGSIKGCERFKIDMLKWVVALIGPSNALECRHCRQRTTQLPARGRHRSWNSSNIPSALTWLHLKPKVIKKETIKNRTSSSSHVFDHACVTGSKHLGPCSTTCQSLVLLILFLAHEYDQNDS